MRELGKIEGEISANQRAIAKEREKQAKDEFKTVYLKDVEEVVQKVGILESIVEIKNLLKSFISMHKDKNDSSFIAESEKELKNLLAKKSEFEKSLKKLDENERSNALEYNALRQKIEQEKDSNRDAEKNVFRIIAKQNEIRGILNGLKTSDDKHILEEESFKRELQEA